MPTKSHAPAGPAGRRAKNHQEQLKKKNENILKIPGQRKNAENKVSAEYIFPLTS